MRAYSAFLSTLAASILFAAASPSTASTGYLRFPDLHGDRVVYCAEGDLWISSTMGGPSRRLTTHPGTEYFPHFSPDGAWIAFTGQYDGNMDVYLTPVEGGAPKRLTWHPKVDEVIGSAGVTKGAFFHHFRTKSDLGHALVERFARRDRAHLERNIQRAERLAGDPLTQLLILVGLFLLCLCLHGETARAMWK